MLPRLISRRVVALTIFAILIFFFILYENGLLNALEKLEKNSVQFTSSSATLQKLQEAEETVRLLKSSLRTCSSLSSQFKKCSSSLLNNDLPVIYVITPTHEKYVQKAELVRIKTVLLHVPSIHWIIVEDSATKTQLVTNFLNESQLKYTHLVKETPKKWKLGKKDPRWLKHRGVLQRNEALKWVRSNAKSGVVYFADDDNTYSIELFDQMRDTKKVSVWPVGLVGGVKAEHPILDSQGHVIGWNVGWRPDRAFATDMAGFAVSVSTLLKNPDIILSLNSARGFLESNFLEKLITLEELEAKADLCRKVLVWHTQTKVPKLDKLQIQNRNNMTNNNLEV